VIMRLSISAVLAASLAASACAREAESSEVEAEMVAVASTQETSSATAPVFDFPESDWRDLDPENTLYIETDHGRVIVELAPEFAPRHVERMKTLVRQQFYDFLIWHRVIDGFMAQGGGSRSNPAHSTDLPDMEAEFTIRRGGELTVSELQDRVINESQIPQTAKAGFWNGFPAGTQTLAAAALMGDGRVQSWLLHCQGAASMARTNDPNSAGSQFYLTRGDADHLNAVYTVWGRVRVGQEAVDAIRVGTMHQDVGFVPDLIRSMRIGADLPEVEQVDIQVLDTNSSSFTQYLDTLRNDTGQLPDVCDITVPTRILE